ncbi:MAG: cyclase family protein [Candidatus Omnitrophota bacterium]
MNKKMKFLILSILIVSCSLFFTSSVTAGSLLSKAKHGRVIDLSHTLSESIPSLPFFPISFDLTNIIGNGTYVNYVSYVEHIGTHVDAPSHFGYGGNNIDQVSLDQLFLPAIVIDVTEQVEGNDDYELTVEDILNWEKENGKIPDNAFVIAYTGWQENWSDPAAYRNMDTFFVMHFPGLSPEAITFLATERNISGIGIDTFTPDNGVRMAAYQMTAHDLLLGSTNKLIIENLTNLDKLPPKNITLIIAPLAVEDGSGSPARIFAVLP